MAEICRLIFDSRCCHREHEWVMEISSSTLIQPLQANMGRDTAVNNFHLCASNTNNACSMLQYIQFQNMSIAYRYLSSTIETRILYNNKKEGTGGCKVIRKIRR